MADYYKPMLDELRSDLAAAESTQEELKLRCSRLQAAIAVVEEKIEATGSNDVRVATPEHATQNLFEMLSMPDAIRNCLMHSPGPLSKRELMARLRKGGMAEGNHFSQSVYNTLYRLSKKGGSVCKEADGRWSWVRNAPVSG